MRISFEKDLFVLFQLLIEILILFIKTSCPPLQEAFVEFSIYLLHSFLMDDEKVQSNSEAQFLARNREEVQEICWSYQRNCIIKMSPSQAMNPISNT